MIELSKDSADQVFLVVETKQYDSQVEVIGFPNKGSYQIAVYDGERVAKTGLDEEQALDIARSLLYMTGEPDNVGVIEDLAAIVEEINQDVSTYEQFAVDMVAKLRERNWILVDTKINPSPKVKLSYNEAGNVVVQTDDGQLELTGEQVQAIAEFINES